MSPPHGTPAIACTIPLLHFDAESVAVLSFIERDITRPVGFSRRLLDVVNDGCIVTRSPDAPDFVAIRSERLAGVGNPSDIDDHRLPVCKEYEMADIVVIVVFVVVAPLCREDESHPGNRVLPDFQDL